MPTEDRLVAELLAALKVWRHDFAGADDLEGYHDVILPETARVIRAYDALMESQPPGNPAGSESE